MKLLVDTHIFIWWTQDSQKLSPAVRSAIADPGSALYLSTASIWEIIIKQQLGKLKFPEPLEQSIPQTISHYGLSLLPIELSHLFRLQGLPLHHRDPFDRLLVAQAMAENLTLATSDTPLSAYGIPLLF